MAPVEKTTTRERPTYPVQDCPSASKMPEGCKEDMSASRATYLSGIPEGICPSPDLGYMLADTYTIGTPSAYVDDNHDDTLGLLVRRFFNGFLETAESRPEHTAQLSSYCMNTHEVTQEQVASVAPEHPALQRIPGEFRGTNRPMVFVTQSEANKICQSLYPANNGRLPTEHQWEAAARGQNSANWYGIAHSNRDCLLYETAVSKKPSGGFGIQATTEVDGFWCEENDTISFHDFQPNNFGFFNLTGNVREWTADCFDPAAYKKLSDTVVDPFNNPSQYENGECPGNYGVVRDVSWAEAVQQRWPYDTIAVWNRQPWDTGTPNNLTGFRCVTDPVFAYELPASDARADESSTTKTQPPEFQDEMPFAEVYYNQLTQSCDMPFEEEVSECLIEE